MVNLILKEADHYYFNNANKHADWKEKLGNFFLSPLHYTKGYTKISFESSSICKEVAGKTSSVALFIFQIFNFIGAAKIGKAFLKASASHQEQYAKLKFFFECNQGASSQYISEEPVQSERSKGLNPSEINMFYKTVEQWSYLEGILQVYQEFVLSKAPYWTNKKASTFLLRELLYIQSNMKNLEKNAEKLIQLYEKSLDSDEIDVNNLRQLHGLIEHSKILEEKYQSFLQILKPRLTQNIEISVIGLGNAGNTCYINSSLQPLLAIKNFKNLVPNEIVKNPNESEEVFAGRKNILASFKTVIEAWEIKCSPLEVGKLIGKMRTTIFQAGLMEGGFINSEDERTFQDAGSFFELILHVIGQGFQLNTIRKFKLPDGTDKIVGGPNPQSVLQLKEENGSIQDKINAFSQVQEDELKQRDSLKHTDPGTGKVLKLTQFTEENKILGLPQELLVFRVENHVVDPAKDRLINCAGLFNSTLNPDDANYELAGFAQNHNQVHWTSVVYDNGVWKYCNDSHVKTVETSDDNFLHPANYLVYRRKQKGT